MVVADGAAVDVDAVVVAGDVDVDDCGCDVGVDDDVVVVELVLAPVRGAVDDDDAGVGIEFVFKVVVADVASQTRALRAWRWTWVEGQYSGRSCNTGTNTLRYLVCSPKAHVTFLWARQDRAKAAATRAAA